MRLKLYCSTQQDAFSTPGNEGFDRNEILQLLETLQRQGRITYDTVDSSKLSDLELHEIYTQAATPAMIKGRTGYNVRQVFGSRRLSGVHFGKGVPALLVYEESGKYPTDVYPHRMGQATITIRKFLEGLL